MRKRLEKKVAALEAENEVLCHRERSIRALLDSLDDVIWSASGDGSRIDYGSAAIERVYGRSVDEFLENDHRWSEHIHPDDRERALEEAKALERGETVESVYRIIRPDGEVRWIRDRKGVVPDSDSSEVVIGGIATDFTELRKIEDDLAKRSANLSRQVNLMAGREVRMTELKEVVGKLRTQLAAAGLTPVANDPREGLG